MSGTATGFKSARWLATRHDPAALSEGMRNQIRNSRGELLAKGRTSEEALGRGRG